MRVCHVMMFADAAARRPYHLRSYANQYVKELAHFFKCTGHHTRGVKHPEGSNELKIISERRQGFSN